jgi:hypothetical protein
LDLYLWLSTLDSPLSTLCHLSASRRRVGLFLWLSTLDSPLSTLRHPGPWPYKCWIGVA